MIVTISLYVILIIMEGNALRTLFKSIMKSQQQPMSRQLEVISLMYPITMEEITVPVRNRGCNEYRVCVWPLESLMKEAQQQANRGKFHQKSQNLSNSYFTCKMCAQETKSAKRSYQDFYFDRKLDYLIRAAKVKYLESFSDQFDFKKDPKSKSKVEKSFKYSKLFIHKGGGVILQYKKKIADGGKVTYRTVVFQDTLAHYSEQLVFNPKDYSINLSALKITQNFVQRRLGEAIDRGFEQVSGCYSAKYQQYLQNKLGEWIIEYLQKHTHLAQKEQLYAAKMTANQSTQNKKNFELIIFYPRYNLTQIYTFDKQEDILNSCMKQTMKICKFDKKKMLLYTSDFTYIIDLEESLHKKQSLCFRRPIVVKDNEQGILMERDVAAEVKYPKQWQSYHRCPQKYMKFDSVRPMIESPVLISNPNNPNEVFLFGGTIQGITNTFVHRLVNDKWVRQRRQLKWSSDHLLVIVELGSMFVLGFNRKGTEKEPLSQLYLHELEIVEGQLNIKQTYNLNKQIKSNYLLPLRAKDNQYILADLGSKQPPLYLDLVKKELKTYKIKQDIVKFMKQLYDIRNQKLIFQSYPACSITHNQLTYNILSNSIAKHTFKIFYGCGDEWMSSDLSQMLIHD